MEQPRGAVVTERDPLLSRDPIHVQRFVKPTKVYWQRWYILLLYSLNACVQGCLYNGYFTISDTVKVAFNWTNGDMGLINMWAPLVGILMMPLAAAIMESGFRNAMLGSAFLGAFGAGLRCLTTTNPWNLILANAFSIVGGLASQVNDAGGTTISILWFPVYQRATATGIAWLLNLLGISFLIGPNLVRSCDDFFKEENALELCTHDVAVVNMLKSDVVRLFLIEFAAAVVIFIAVVLYFPDRPPTPPSRSAVIERVHVKAAIPVLLKKGDFWLATCALALSAGIYNAWSSALSFNMNLIGISQVTAGWLGFWGSIGTAVTCFLSTRTVDVLGGRTKPIAIFILSVGVCSSLWFTLICIKVLPVSTVSLYAATIMLGGSAQGCIALLYEMACEAAYPVTEATASTLIYSVYNIVNIVFLAIFLIPNLDQSWMNWVMLGSTTASVLLMILFRETPTRSKIDKTPDAIDTDQHS